MTNHDVEASCRLADLRQAEAHYAAELKASRETIRAYAPALKRARGGSTADGCRLHAERKAGG